MMCRALAAEKPSSRMHRTVSSISKFTSPVATLLTAGGSVGAARCVYAQSPSHTLALPSVVILSSL